VRVLGYSFPQAADASRASKAITERFGLQPGDAKIGDLAQDGTVLGVRTREDNVADVERLLAEHGGTPLTDVDERWTGLRPRS
jgi:hypothetical protein